MNFWTPPTTKSMYTRSQNYTNLVVGEHTMQVFKVVVVVLFLLLLSFGVFIPTRAYLLLFLDKRFVQIYPNITRIYTTPIISISTCYYSELRASITI